MAVRPGPAYEGDAPYVFVSYAHEDRKLVYPEIERLQTADLKVWYDEGISPGREWTDALADAIDGCTDMIFFISPAAVASRHCRSEVQYALQQGKRVIPVYLRPTELPGGLQLSLGLDQAILSYELTAARYRRKLHRTLGLVDGPELQHPPRTDRRSILLLVITVVLAAGAWWGWQGASQGERTPQTTMDTGTSGIAVLPFVVRGPAELHFLSEGMVDLLVARLNSLPGFQAIDPFSIVKVAGRYPRSREDPEAARTVAAILNADRFVMGSVTGTPEDMQMTATLYAGSAAVASAVTNARVGEVTAAVDHLTRQLIARELKAAYETYASLAASTTGSMDALQSYLAGERAFRRGHFETATQRFHEATMRDGDFAMAWFRLVIASTLVRPELGLEAQQRASELRDRLPPPQRELQRVYELGDAGLIREARARVLRLVDSYPTDIEARRMLAEIRFRQNPYFGLDAREAAADFEHILRIDPGDTWSRAYLVELAAMDRNDQLIGQQVAALPSDSRTASLFTLVASYLAGERSALETAKLVIAEHFSEAPWLAYYQAPRMRDRDLVESLVEEMGTTLNLAKRRPATIVLAAGRRDWDAIDTDSFENAGSWLTLAAALTLSEKAPEDLSTATIAWLKDWNPAETGLQGCEDDAARRFGCEAPALSAARDLHLYVLLHRLGDSLSIEVMDRLQQSGAAAGRGSLPGSYAAMASAYRATQERRTGDALTALDRARVGVPFLGLIRGPVASLGLLYQPMLTWNALLTAQTYQQSNQRALASRWYSAASQAG